MANKARLAGVTLLETLIVIAIMALSITLVSPNVSAFLARSRMIAEVNHLSAAVQFTRFNAIDTQQSTTLCPSHNYRHCNVHNWNLPKIIFVDKNRNLTLDSDESLLHATSLPLPKIRLNGPKKAIRFFADGVLGSPATIRFCPAAADPVLNRALIVGLQGRVRLSRDFNQDNIHELRPGKPVNCP